jgi:hypothetical protein
MHTQDLCQKFNRHVREEMGFISIYFRNNIHI